MPDHAFLSASSSSRWIACPPSAMLCAQKAKDAGSVYAQEGTDAHTLCEYLLSKRLGRSIRDPTEDLDYYNAEMQDAADDYASFVMEQVEEAKQRCRDPLICVEQRLDFSRWVPNGFGTADCLIVSDGVMYVVDFKYGVGVLVSASGEDGTGNTQLKCYALGALDTFGHLYDVKKVRMTIFQPRRSNVDTFEMTTDDLLAWADGTLAPIAALAYAGEGDFKAGDHCLFCKAKTSCRALADYNQSLAKYDFREPALLSDEEIADVLRKVEPLISWANSVKEYALQKALSGTQYPGFKVAEGRSNRKYSDEEAVAKVVSEAGYEPYEKKLLGVTAMTKQLGKKQFDELLSGLVYRPQGKPVLVPESDKRPEFNTAANDFRKETVS